MNGPTTSIATSISSRRNFNASTLQVRFKQWGLSGSQPRWEQVEPFVSQTCQSDCWILIAAKAGLQQNADNEELACAFKRAHEI